jgi:hypothetical protein
MVLLVLLTNRQRAATAASVAPAHTASVNIRAGADDAEAAATASPTAAAVVTVQ